MISRATAEAEQLTNLSRLRSLSVRWMVTLLSGVREPRFSVLSSWGISREGMMEISAAAMQTHITAIADNMSKRAVSTRKCSLGNVKGLAQFELIDQFAAASHVSPTKRVCICAAQH